ncbi:pyridoxal phosphate-dependent decarboxylase family protein [Paucibacter sp. DJ2R-2]|uniref:pyridoxal phosphate-dependent decarboxylase family protein n=1 Tax=Paucibacter sp. DJ2R-2 TaxID=2893558 RepID=UPI0021E4E509|nr:pyridoxal-dependent decarboxylase [Paucibacter sp. DJ2R-2]MCV2419802.1 pyridoxal-dependent decarboxylase [Paucibacter sp. DJ4R-1]MCV2437295.1 pyridoxal-dependent decarboxylase [Paucibacter sp. DJ2R-2]
MHELLKHDLETLPELLAQTRATALQSLQGLDSQPVAVQPQTPQAELQRAAGGGAEAALRLFEQRWLPRLSASAGPRYLGFVTGGATPASLMGDWLTSALDQNPTAGWDSEAPELERQTVRELGSWFGLSEAHEGAFVSGATMSNFVGLALAREWLGEQRGVRVSEAGAAALGPVTVLSGAAHSSIHKALSMLGMGRNAVHPVATLPGRDAIDPQALELALQAQAGAPVIVVANAGTVNSGDFDELPALLALRARYPFWLHVDAAFGAFAALDERVAAQVQGLDGADSVCIDCHKWLNVPYDSALQFSRHRALQLRVFQNSAAYLGEIGERPDFVHLTPENSRRWRALPAWFAVQAYGRAGQAEIVRRNIDCARLLAELLQQDLTPGPDGGPAFELLAPVRLNIVCFAVAGCTDAASVQRFLERLRDSGEAFLTPTYFLGRWAVRAAFSNWRSEARDVQRVHAALLALVQSA